MNIKHNVQCAGLHPDLVEAMMKVAVLYDNLGIKGVRACVTSVMDGRHSSNSLHYQGKAFDVRTWADTRGNQMSVNEKEAIANKVRDILGGDFDVVVESTHIHIELDN